MPESAQTSAFDGVLRAPREVLFGAGTAERVGALAAHITDRVLVICDPAISSLPAGKRVLDGLRVAGISVQIFDQVVPDLPLEAIGDGIREAAGFKPGCVIGLGGGSSLDLAKLVALGLTHGDDLRTFYGEEQIPGPVAPVIAIPTTAGTGSEVTPVAVVTDPEAELKVGIASRHLIPSYAIVDPELTHGCPASVSAHAGMDALAHAIESFTAAHRPDAVRSDAVFVGKNALSDAYALDAIAHIAPHLEASLDDDPQARAAVAYGSLSAGLAFGSAGTAAAHALQYPIGARTHTPHGLGTGLLLGYVMAFNRSVRAHELAEVGRAAGWADAASTDDEAAGAAIAGVFALARSTGLPTSLAEIAIAEQDLPAIAQQAAGVSRLISNNPRPATSSELEKVLKAAWRGEPTTTELRW